MELKHKRVERGARDGLEGAQEIGVKEMQGSLNVLTATSLGLMGARKYDRVGLISKETPHNAQLAPWI